MDGLDDVVDDLHGGAVLVVGDAMLDEYVLGSAVRICREGPAPVVHVTRRRREPGGAGNVAANAAALGAVVTFLSVVGDDRDGHLLREALRARGVPDDDVLTEPGRTTLAKRRVVADGQLLLRVDDGDPVDLSRKVEDELLCRLDAAYPNADAVIVSDYGYRVVSDRMVERLAVLQRRHGGVLVVDAHDLTRFRQVAATAVKPNYGEALQLMSRQPAQGSDRAAVVAAEARHVLEVTGSRIAAVTLDVDGAVVCERGRPPYRTWARPGASTGACGAGDSYTATLALALARGLGATSAAELAQAAAEVVTGREGTSTCSADDLRQQVGGGTEAVRVPEELAEVVAFHRRQGRRVVFTNGCFDLLHRGHVELLRRAKGLGDVLVVGLNTDDSVRRLKGPERPINSLEDRARVLAALGCVDHITAFEDEVASRLVDLLQPDVYVKGGDYVPSMLPEAPHVEAYGGVVHILPYIENRSTTSLIRRIRS